MRYALILSALALMAVPAFAAAGHRGSSFSIGFGVSSYRGGYGGHYSRGYGYDCGPRYYQPAPVYYAPAPVYYPAPVVYHRPAPVYVAPAPVYCAPPVAYYRPAPVYCAPPVAYSYPQSSVSVGVSYYYGR